MRSSAIHVYHMTTRLLKAVALATMLNSIEYVINTSTSTVTRRPHPLTPPPPPSPSPTPLPLYDRQAISNMQYFPANHRESATYQMLTSPHTTNKFLVHAPTHSGAYTPPRVGNPRDVPKQLGAKLGLFGSV